MYLVAVPVFSVLLCSFSIKPKENRGVDSLSYSARDSTKVDKVNQLISLYGAVKINHKNLLLSMDKIVYSTATGIGLVKNGTVKDGNQRTLIQGDFKFNFKESTYELTELPASF